MAKDSADNSKPKTRTALVNELADATGLTRKQVTAVFDALNGIIKKEMGKKGPGVLNVMKLVKVYRVVKPARKAGTKPNPFKPGEMMEVKAKPASTVIKVRPLKDLKELV